MPEQTLRPETAERVCATCGRPLTQLGENGECLRCLVSVGLGGDEEQAPARSASRQRATPGPLRYAHFEIETGSDGFPVELGWGAMAVTYRARDTVLNSIVALKIIDRTIAANPAARARFLREARAAAQLHHPNVARVTHYGEQDSECFYVMELVEGETLEARVRRDGPMPLALALEVIEQTARALAAAEAHGIVHRDIKPSNVMIEKEAGGSTLVKVIDYGVAKMTSLQAEIGLDQTQTQFVGTPAFASPEQFGGPGRTPIDARSDIYSLGVTLWYLLSGRTPFVGRTLEALGARQTDDLPVQQLRRADVPAPVLALLKSMLAIDPADRPQSARDLLAAVHRCYLRFEPRARSRRKYFLLASGIGLFLLAATLSGIWFNQWARSRAQAERSVAVLPFENLSPNGEDAYFAVGMQDEITSDLARLAGMKVIGSQSTRSYVPGKHRDLGRIARELGVRHLIEGTVSRDNGQVRVALQLVDVRNATRPWRQGYDRQVKDLFTLQSEITRAIATQLNTELSPNEEAALNTPPTTELRAYDLYLQARAMPSLILEMVGAQFYSDAKRAIPLLEEAIQRDPNFLLAYCELARWHDEIHFRRNVGPPEERAIDHRSLSDAALEKARRLQPDSSAVHLALARHALFITNNLEECEIQIRLARSGLPNNSEVEMIAGRLARRQNRWDEAISCLEKAVSLQPRDVPLRYLLAFTYRYTRRYDQYDQTMGGVIDLTPPDKLGTLPIERAYGSLERSADLRPFREALATQIARHQLDESDTTTQQMMLALWSHDAESVSAILSRKTTPIGWNGVIYPDAWFEALAARIRGDNAAAVKAFAVARPEMEKRVLADPTDSLHLSTLAVIDAGLGRKADAVREAKQACDLASSAGNNFRAPMVRCNLAVVYAWTGQNDPAIAELTPLIDRPAISNAIAQPTYGDFRLNPLWDPLRGDPRFAALIQRLAPPLSL